jgi:hypothetical protein
LAAAIARSLLQVIRNNIDQRSVWVTALPVGLHAIKIGIVHS